MNVAGIDVSAKELVVVVSVKGKAGKAKCFENTAAVIKPLSACFQNTKVKRGFVLKRQGFITLI